MATAILKSKITKRSQTTLPRAVKNALRLDAGDELGYVIEGNEVRLVNAAMDAHEDPLVMSFLAFLAADVQAHPQLLTSFPPALLAQMEALSAGVIIDHDAEIAGETAL